MLEGEWNALNEILHRKSDSLAAQIPLLQGKIVEEEKAIDLRIRVSGSRDIRGSLICVCVVVLSVLSMVGEGVGVSPVSSLRRLLL